VGEHGGTLADAQNVPQTTEHDVVEAALANALTAAVAAAQWQVVSQLAGELHARRWAREARAAADGAKVNSMAQRRERGAP
jgi:hypothetical protein